MYFLQEARFEIQFESAGSLEKTLGFQATRQSLDNVGPVSFLHDADLQEV